MAHAAEAYPDPWGLPSMHLKQTITSTAHAAEAYPDPWGLPSVHLKQPIASMAHAAETYPDAWGLPSMHSSKQLPAWRMQLRLTQIPGAYPACIQAKPCACGRGLPRYLGLTSTHLNMFGSRSSPLRVPLLPPQTPPHPTEP